MGRVNVVDPYSGVTLDVDEESPQAKLWVSRIDEPAQEQPDESDAADAEPAKRKPGRPKRAD